MRKMTKFTNTIIFALTAILLSAGFSSAAPGDIQITTQPDPSKQVFKQQQPQLQQKPMLQKNDFTMAPPQRVMTNAYLHPKPSYAQFRPVTVFERKFCESPMGNNYSCNRPDQTLRWSTADFVILQNNYGKLKLDFRGSASNGPNGTVEIDLRNTPNNTSYTYQYKLPIPFVSSNAAQVFCNSVTGNGAVKRKTAVHDVRASIKLTGSDLTGKPIFDEIPIKYQVNMECVYRE